MAKHTYPQAPPENSSLARFRAMSEPMRAVIDTALCCALGELRELPALVRDLAPDEREQLCSEGHRVFTESDADVRSMILLLGLLGGPRDALELGDLVCAIGATDDAAWRWDYAIEALRLLGTRDAHMQVQRIAMESMNPQVIAVAREKLLYIAGDRGVPLWEVQDELVPACGLDEHGGVKLDYGPRSFELQLDEALEPWLFERPGGERHRNLPPANQDDDPQAVARTTSTWAVTREQLREAIPVQVHRFEEALAQQTRWSGARWDRVVRRHPLLIHLVPRLVWGTYNKGGKRLLETFRVAPDHTLWGPDDEPYELDLDHPIGVVHPYELAPELRAAWSEVLADYEVVTLFPQIDRPVLRPDPDLARQSAVPLDIRVPSHSALVELHRRGWQIDSGWGHRLQKVFRAQDVKAAVSYTQTESEIVIESVSFERYLGYPQSTFQLRDVRPIPYSETIYEFEKLRLPQETGGWPAVVGAR